jgi:DNA-binding IclR family transcriptional regulator
VRTTGRVGASFPAHSTSGGKALLAELDAPALRALYPDDRLSALTQRTIGSREALEAELAAVRERGYAVNAGESDPHVTSVAAVVRDAGGAARFALSVSMPAFRADPDAVADALIEACLEAGRTTPAPPGGSARPAA